MQSIQMVDLYGQYLKIKEEVDQGISEVIKSSSFLKSGKVIDFEKQLSEYLGIEVISCGNGTDALQIAFMALGLNPGDEVITSPFTFVSTVEVLVLLGLKPVFADVNLSTFNIDNEEINRVISPRTKAILPVHLFGQCSEMETIMETASIFGLYVIEDAAQALGADLIFKNREKKKAGTIGTIGITSFFPTKNLGAFGDGGAVFCDDQIMAQKIRVIANHGMKRKYEYEFTGVNSRLDSIQAAVLQVKLKRLNKYIQKKQRIAEFYNSELKPISKIKLPEKAEYSSHTYHQYTIQTEDRDRLKEFLKNMGIQTKVYYPRPIHLQEAYKFLGYSENDFPKSEQLSRTVLSLPIHTELKKGQLIYIIQAIKDFYHQ